MPRTLQTERVVIVGAGMGALYAALKLAPTPVLMLSPDPPGQGASSAWAQGGVAAAMAQDDSAHSHAADTIAAGAGTVDADVAASVTEEARTHILDLTTLGTPFDRTADGKYVLSREAAHSHARVVRVRGDQAGREIMAALAERVAATPSIQLVDGVLVTGLEVEHGKVVGVWIERADGPPGEPILIECEACLLAGGGSCGLYAITTNPPRVRGQVIGLAARAGARIADAEFVQFHPTAIDTGEDPAPLATEALRGEGAILINRKGERFMEGIHPAKELAPRDIVARAIFAQTQAGLRPMLDTRSAIGARILDEFPAAADACLRAGIDPVSQPIPVAAAAHYHMGGVDTGIDGRASLGNLWVCGEAGSTGLHGANRLASNGLLEALVYASHAAKSIIASGPISQKAKPVVISFEEGGTAIDEAKVAELRSIMTTHVGVVRNASGLRAALVQIAELEARSSSRSFQNMTATATLIAASALMREESRGSHFREDFPAPNEKLATRSHIMLAEAIALRNRIVEEFR